MRFKCEINCLYRKCGLIGFLYTWFNWSGKVIPRKMGNKSKSQWYPHPSWSGPLTIIMTSGRLTHMDCLPRIEYHFGSNENCTTFCSTFMDGRDCDHSDELAQEIHASIEMHNCWWIGVKTSFNMRWTRYFAIPITKNDSPTEDISSTK